MEREREEEEEKWGVVLCIKDVILVFRREIRGDEKKRDEIRWISVYVNLLISALGFIFTMCHTSMH